MGKKEVKHIDLKTISNPNFVKNLSYDELDVLSKDICSYIVESVSKNGGHLSSNLGVVDATIALCKAFDFDKDKIIFDVGHQTYAYKVLTGRSLERLRKSDGVSGFQKVDESPYDHYEAGHSSTSISAANGFAIARDLSGDKYDIVAFIGDGSISNGLAFEGMNVSLQRNNKIIIVLNDNDMSISKPVGGLAKVFRKFSTSSFYRKSKHFYQRIMQKTKFGRKIYRFSANVKNWFKRHLIKMNIFDNLGYSVIGPIDGHNIKSMEKAFERAKKNDKSVVVHIKTIKGKGYSFAEEDTNGTWHGVSSFNLETGEQKVSSSLTWSQEYENLIYNKMKDDEKAICIVPGTSVGSQLDPIFKEFPTRIFDVGIAEEHAVVFASGLSINGYHPIISVYSTFLQRAYDEISHDLARMNLNCTFLIDRSGLVGADGNTHQGIYDEAFLYSIPNVVIAMASSIEESNALFTESFNNHGVFAIRYPKEKNVFNLNRDVNLPFGKWILETTGKDTCIISVGPVTRELYNLIKDKNLNCTLINAIYQKPLDEEMLLCLNDYKKIVIYDAYATVNGFSTYVQAKLLQNGYRGEIIVKSIPDAFVGHASIDEQRKCFGLTPEQIIESL